MLGHKSHNIKQQMCSVNILCLQFTIKLQCLHVFHQLEDNMPFSITGTPTWEFLTSYMGLLNLRHISYAIEYCYLQIYGDDHISYDIPVYFTDAWCQH